MLVPFCFMEMKQIEILDLRLIESDKTLRAFADIRLGDITIRDFRIVKKDGRRPHVKAPFLTYKDQIGKLKFRSVIILPEEVRGEVDLVILSAYQREMEKKNGNSTP